jgi:uncharacterized protein YjbI with pentapeptide repeats
MLLKGALEGRPLKGADLSELPKDVVTSFRRADLRKASLVGCSFFKGSDFDLADCAEANFCGSQFRDLSFSGASLAGADLSQCTFKHCVFRRADLRQARLAGATFVSCDFTLCDMTGAATTGETTFFDPENWWRSRRHDWSGPAPFISLSPEDATAQLPARESTHPRRHLRADSKRSGKPARPKRQAY